MSSLPAQNNNSQPKPKRAVTGEGGYQFEIKMAALIGLRGLKKGKDFELSCNIQGAGNFDDIQYKAGNQWYFVQLKHSLVGKCLEVDELTELLRRCFYSYCHISEACQDSSIKSEFIIYTNRVLGGELSEHKTKETDVDVFFKTSESKTFTFTQAENASIDVYTLLRSAVDESKQHKVKGFLEKLIMAIGQKGHRELDDLIINELKDNDIFHDHKDKFRDNTVQYKIVLHHFKTLIENWWRKEETDIMTPKMLKIWLKTAKNDYFKPSINCLYEIYKEKFPKTTIQCFSREVLRLREKLSDNRYVHLSSDALTLYSILLMERVPKAKGIFVTFEILQSNRNMLLHAWLEGRWEYLIVFCDPTVQQTDISNTWHEISKIMTKDHSSKRVIILTAFSVQKIEGLFTIKQEFNFEQLSEESQKTVLDKTIEFQGCEVTMKDVLERHGKVQHVLGPELVTDMITEGTDVNIGGRLQQKPERYISRVLKKRIWFSLDTLKKQNTCRDIFAVSGMEKNELVGIVPPQQKVGEFKFEEDSKQNYDVPEERFILLNGKDLKTSFSKLCKSKSRNTLHWLKHKDKKLLWKKTHGDIKNLLKCIDVKRTDRDKRISIKCVKRGSCEFEENSILHLRERTVLVVAEPGMGKSSTTTQVAWHTKLADPKSWVLRINWNDHTRELKKIDAGKFDSHSLFEFLCSAAFPESKYADSNRILLKHALQYSGKVTVLMDGFDEICPTYTDEALVILSKLMETKVERVWVTSRPVQREILEKQLGVIAFAMKKLPSTSQEKMFWDIWKRSDIKEKVFINRYVKRILSQANDAVYQRNFTGCPFYFTITVSVYEDWIHKSLKEKRVTLPRKLDILLLFDKLVTGKLRIYGEDKKREDLTNASVQDDNENLEEMTMRNLEKCSLLVTLPKKLDRLSNVDVESTIKSFLKRVEAGNDKIGIVMNVVEDRPHFVHRTVADYFTARWFSKNYEFNRSVLEHVLFDRSNSIVRNVFDRILAADSLLHCAVLDRDTEAVGNLLEKTSSGVNDMDKGGRTAMHLIAAQGPGDSVCSEITEILLDKGATLDTKDKVLDWTPLQYARQTGNRVWSSCCRVSF